MKKLDQLRAQRDALARQIHTLNAKHPVDQAMPKADADEIDRLLADVSRIDAEIEREQKIIQSLGEQAAADDARERHTRTPGAHDNGHANAALRAFLAGGLNALSSEQLQAMRSRQTQEILQAMAPVGIQGAMSTTTPAEGGYTVAPEFARELDVAMKAFGAMLEAGMTIRTASGATMNFPTADPTSEVGEIVGQNAAATGADTTFGNVTVDVFRYSSKKIALPWELVQDSFLDLQAYILELLGMRIGRIYGTHSTTGSGTGQPRGIVTGSTVGKTGTTGQTTSITYDDMVDLEHSVDPLYRRMPGVGWMMHDTSLAKIRKIKDSNGRPIFVPGYETGNPGGAPDRLLNRPIFINQDMASMAANAKSVLFGDFKRYKVRQVMDLTLFRFTDSAFTLNGQIGFCGFQRMGGNLVDAGGAVKAYQNSAT